MRTKLGYTNLALEAKLAFEPSMTTYRMSKTSRLTRDSLTGEFRIVSKIAFNIGPMRGRGGVTPHIWTRSMRALDKSSSLSFTEKGYSGWSSAAVNLVRNTFGKAKEFGL